MIRCVRRVRIRADLVRERLRYRRAADHDLHLVAQTCSLQRIDDVFLIHHRGGEKSGEADDVRIVFFDRFHDLLRRAVDAEVDDADTRTLDHHFDEVFADVVQIALDGADDRRADRFNARICQCGFENRKRRVHRARRNKNFGNEDLVVFEFRADDAHARDQSFGEDILRGNARSQLFGDESRQIFCLAALQQRGNFFKFCHKILLFLMDNSYFCYLKTTRNGLAARPPYPVIV